MKNGRMTGVGSFLCALLGIGLSAAVSGCGSDNKTEKDASVDPTVCTAPGIGDTGCDCGTGVPGSRTCGNDLKWTQCVCPDPLPDGALCRPNQRVVCHVCGNSTDKRIMTCDASGNVNCDCPDGT